MKVRDSGMPNEALWEQLFDVQLIMDRLGIGDGLGDVAELGCGYGTFTIAVARRVSGIVYAYDIDEAMASRTRQRAVEAGMRNVVVERRDVASQGFGLASASLDGCLLFNILHHEDPVAMLTAAASAVRCGGRVFASTGGMTGRRPADPTSPFARVQRTLRDGRRAPTGWRLPVLCSICRHGTMGWR